MGDDVRVAACRRGSGPRGARLCELISERAGRSLILTSNRSPAGWYPLFPSPVVAESLLGKLISTSRLVLMTGPGYRPRKRPGRIPWPRRTTPDSRDRPEDQRPDGP
jgi:hypothetical protein